jgi:SAM-dependent methyltransferase
MTNSSNLAPLLAEMADKFRREYNGLFPNLDGAIKTHVELTSSLKYHETHAWPSISSAVINSEDYGIDVGCGYGAAVLLARKKGVTFFGVDNSFEEVRWAVRRWEAEQMPGGHAYVVASAEAMPFRDKCFQYVQLWNVTEHVSNLSGMIDQCTRILKLNGVLRILGVNYAALRDEPHYHVPWFPFLNKQIAVGYLKLLGRNPSFFERNVFLVHARSIHKLLRGNYKVRHPKASKLINPVLCRSKLKRTLISWMKYLGVSQTAQFVLQLWIHVPFRRNIDLVATKISFLDS